MPTYSFSKTNFTARFNWLESRVLGRPQLVLERSRLIVLEPSVIPSKRELGLRVSKKSLLLGLFGEYRTGTSKTLVLGNPKGSELSLKIKVVHPSFDFIWICGPQVNEVQKQLYRTISD